MVCTQLQHALEDAASEQHQATPPVGTGDQQRPSAAGSPKQQTISDKASAQAALPADSAAYDCCSRDGAHEKHKETAPGRKDTPEKHTKSGKKSRKHEAHGQHTPNNEKGKKGRYAQTEENWWDERQRGRAELRHG